MLRDHFNISSYMIYRVEWCIGWEEGGTYEHGLILPQWTVSWKALSKLAHHLRSLGCPEACETKHKPGVRLELPLYALLAIDPI